MSVPCRTRFFCSVRNKVIARATVATLGVRFYGIERRLSGSVSVCCGSGPEVKLYALTGGCNSLSGHSKVKIGGCKPAKTGGAAHVVQGCSDERTPAQDAVIRRGGGNDLNAARGTVPVRDHDRQGRSLQWLPFEYLMMPSSSTVSPGLAMTCRAVAATVDMRAARTHQLAACAVLAVRMGYVRYRTDQQRRFGLGFLVRY
jgi:hypothetical protein